MARAIDLARARPLGPLAAKDGALLARTRTLAWAVYGVLGLVGLGAYFLIADQRAQDLAYDVYGLTAVGAILVGVRLNKPARRVAWITLALGAALLTAGDLALSYLGSGAGEMPFPSVADALYLAGYAALASSLVQLARSHDRGRDPAAWVDALIVAGAATVVAWTLIFDQYLADPTLSPLGVLVSMAYPFADLVLLAVVAHLILVSRRLSPSLVLLALAFGANFAADIWFIFLSFDSTYQVGQLVDAGWLLSYVAFGAAALHPAMAQIGESDRAAQRPDGISRLRLLLLGAGAVVGPASALGAMARGVALDVPSVLVGSGLLYILVLYRVWLSLREQQRLTEEKTQLGAELRHQATHDPLTGVANRPFFIAQLEAALQHRRVAGGSVSVLYFDVDRFKGVNDRLGHAAGDEVLAAVACRLREAIRSTNVVGRLGGDEFAILLEGDDETATYAVAARVQALLTAPVEVKGGSFAVTASIGIATARDDERPDELIRHADLAMYEAKADGGAAHAVYAPELDTELKERLALEADLRTALGNDELCLYYQPIIELATGLVSGMEVLVRWQHPTRGLLLPGAFLPVAEVADLMEPLERWVIRTAIRQASAWQSAGVLRRPLTLNINVSARHLGRPGFLRTFAADLTSSGLGSGLIALELTETDLVSDATHLSHTLAALRRAGVRVVIDDFGTAYASLSYLADFPVDGIKIDRAFVAALDSIAGPQVNLARVMVDLARDFGITAIAEGVETTEQAQALVAIGCRYAQGFLFGRPMPAADAAGLLAVGRVAPMPTNPTSAPYLAVEPTRKSDSPATPRGSRANRSSRVGGTLPLATRD